MSSSLDRRKSKQSDLSLLSCAMLHIRGILAFVTPAHVAASYLLSSLCVSAGVGVAIHCDKAQWPHVSLYISSKSCCRCTARVTSHTFAFAAAVIAIIAIFAANATNAKATAVTNRTGAATATSIGNLEARSNTATATAANNVDVGDEAIVCDHAPFAIDQNNFIAATTTFGYRLYQAIHVWKRRIKAYCAC
jgi:hypothetical protein